MKRKKRLKKGIDSIEKQILIHENKLGEVVKVGDEDLARYYVSEIGRLRKRKDNREEKLKRE